MHDATTEATVVVVVVLPAAAVLVCAVLFPANVPSQFPARLDRNIELTTLLDVNAEQ